MSRIGYMFRIICGAMVALLLTLNPTVAKAQDDMSDSDVVHELLRVKGQLRLLCESFSAGTAARGDCAVAQTSVARACSNGCDDPSELVQAQRDIAGIWKQIRYIKDHYATKEDLTELDTALRGLVSEVDKRLGDRITALEEWQEVKDELDAQQDADIKRHDDAITGLGRQTMELREDVSEIQDAVEELRSTKVRAGVSVGGAIGGNVGTMGDMPAVTVSSLGRFTGSANAGGMLAFEFDLPDALNPMLLDVRVTLGVTLNGLNNLDIQGLACVGTYGSKDRASFHGCASASHVLGGSREEGSFDGNSVGGAFEARFYLSKPTAHGTFALAPWLGGRYVWGSSTRYTEYTYFDGKLPTDGSTFDFPSVSVSTVDAQVGLNLQVLFGAPRKFKPLRRR